MKLADLIKEVAGEAGVTKDQAERVIKALGDATGRALRAGDEVTLPGIGKLSVTQRAARTGRNPSNGAEIQIPAKSVPKFSAAKALKDAVA